MSERRTVEAGERSQTPWRPVRLPLLFVTKNFFARSAGRLVWSQKGATRSSSSPAQAGVGAVKGKRGAGMAVQADRSDAITSVGHRI